MKRTIATKKKMPRLTAGARKRIYLAALDLLASSDFLTGNVETRAQYDRYVCHAVKHAVRQELGAAIDHETVRDLFPEAYAFRTGHSTSLWLSEYKNGAFTMNPYTEEGNQLRQTVLAFAAELCDDRDFQGYLAAGESL
jgi:hypothetical protein